MSEMILLARKPTHPGEVLREEFLAGFNLSVATVANALGVSRQSMNELVHERRSVSHEMALRLSRYFQTTPQFWLNLQRNYDIWESMGVNAKAIEAIVPLEIPAEEL
jgi:antitoxin HigA-1